jgi:hypothetical protein
MKGLESDEPLSFHSIRSPVATQSPGRAVAIGSVEDFILAATTVPIVIDPVHGRYGNA